MLISKRLLRPHVAYLVGLVLGLVVGGAIMLLLMPFIQLQPQYSDTPQDFFSNDQIWNNLKGDTFFIKHENLYRTGFADTGSMHPVIDGNSTGLCFYNFSAQTLTNGDIIHFFKHMKNRTTLAHRIVDIGSDNNGWFARTKGDANPVPDDNKVRRKQIIGVLIGIIY